MYPSVVAVKIRSPAICIAITLPGCPSKTRKRWPDFASKHLTAPSPDPVTTDCQNSRENLNFPYCDSTVWKFQKFHGAQILREIDFGLI